MNAVKEQVIPDPADIAASIGKAWERHLLKSRSAPGKRPYVYASAYSECDRRMALEMVAGDQQPSFDADTLARFERGNDRERDLLLALTRVGREHEPPFEVQSQQERFELLDHKERVAIVGKVDARLRFPWGSSAPLEVKAWSPYLTANIRTFEDLFRSPWTLRGAYQLLAYLLGSNEPVGFLLLDRSGLPTLIPVELYPNLERIEKFLTKAELALDHKDTRTLPDFINDPAECKRCPFYGSVCNPPLYHAGAQLVIDPDLEAALERREELKAAADEFDGLDKQVKEKLRGTETAVAGNFLIKGKWGRSTTYDIPAEFKRQYEHVNLKGRFTLEITKVSQ